MDVLFCCLRSGSKTSWPRDRKKKKKVGACFCTLVDVAKSIMALGVPGPSLSLVWKFLFQALKAGRVRLVSLWELFKALDKNLYKTHWCSFHWEKGAV